MSTFVLQAAISFLEYAEISTGKLNDARRDKLGFSNSELIYGGARKDV